TRRVNHAPDNAARFNRLRRQDRSAETECGSEAHRAKERARNHVGPDSGLRYQKRRILSVSRLQTSKELQRTPHDPLARDQVWISRVRADPCVLKKKSRAISLIFSTIFRPRSKSVRHFAEIRPDFSSERSIRAHRRTTPRKNLRLIWRPDSTANLYRRRIQFP